MRNEKRNVSDPLGFHMSMGQSPRRSQSVTAYISELLLNKGWKSILGLVTFEFVLAQYVSAIRVAEYSFLIYYVQLVQHVAPVIAKIDTRISSHPEVVRVYMALTLPLLIPKTVALYRWLAGARNSSIGRQLIVSPLTTTHAGSVDQYILEPIHGANKAGGQERSWKSRIVWSFLIVAFTVTLAILFLVGGKPTSGNSVIRETFINLGQGGISMWWAWSAKWMVFMSFLLAISGTIGRDYLAYFKQQFNQSSNRRSS